MVVLVAVRPSMWTKKRPTGAGSRRKFPNWSVMAKSSSSRPSTVILTPWSGQLTESSPEAASGEFGGEDAAADDGAREGW